MLNSKYYYVNEGFSVKWWLTLLWFFQMMSPHGSSQKDLLWSPTTSNIRKTSKDASRKASHVGTASTGTTCWIDPARALTGQLQGSRRSLLPAHDAAFRINFFFFFFFFFDLGFTALSRIFHLYRADRSSKVGENRRTRRKTTWPSVSRTWLSHIWLERGSNHSGEKPNGLRVNSLIH